MEFLIIWLGSVVASIGFSVSLVFKVFKDVADQGYKFDIKRLKELVGLLNPEAIKTNKMLLFFLLLIFYFNLII